MTISLTILMQKHGLSVNAMRTIKFGSYFLKKHGPRYTVATQELKQEVWKMLYLLLPAHQLSPFSTKILKIRRHFGKN